jgi:hypothetical protein
MGERSVDVYQKLRPWTEIEACQCPSIEGLLLLDSLTDNPLHCSVCLREIDPERAQLTVDETGAVATWFSAASALYRLWLHSGEYEEYAKAKLTDPAGQVNRAGLQVARQLSTRIPTRLVFFRDTDDAEPTQCPVCGTPLTTSVRRGVGECPSCPLLI